MNECGGASEIAFVRVYVLRLEFYIFALAALSVLTWEICTTNLTLQWVSLYTILRHISALLSVIGCHVLTSTAALLTMQGSQGVRVRLSLRKKMTILLVFAAAGMGLGLALSLLLQCEDRLPFLDRKSFKGLGEAEAYVHKHSVRPALVKECEVYAYLMVAGLLSSVHSAWVFIRRKDNELRLPLLSLDVLSPLRKQAYCSLCSAAKSSVLMGLAMMFSKVLCPTSYWPLHRVSRWVFGWIARSGEGGADDSGDAAAVLMLFQQGGGLSLWWIMYLTCLIGFLNHFVHDFSLHMLRLMLTQPLHFQKLFESLTSSKKAAWTRSTAAMLLDGLRIGSNRVLVEATEQQATTAVGVEVVRSTADWTWQDVCDVQYKTLALKAEASHFGGSGGSGGVPPAIQPQQLAVRLRPTVQSWDVVALQNYRRLSAAFGVSCSSPVVMGATVKLPLWAELAYMLAMQELASLSPFMPQLRNEIIKTNAVEVVLACCLFLDTLNLQLQIFAYERDPAVCATVLGTSEGLLAEQLVKGVGDNDAKRQDQGRSKAPKDPYRGQHLTASCLQTALFCVQGLVNLLGANDTSTMTSRATSTSAPGTPLYELLTVQKCVPAVLNSLAGLSLAITAAARSVKIASLPPLLGKEVMSADMNALALVTGQGLHCVVKSYATCLPEFRFPPAYAAVINQHHG